jgi:hypothetical protein
MVLLFANDRAGVKQRAPSLQQTKSIYAFPCEQRESLLSPAKNETLCSTRQAKRIFAFPCGSVLLDRHITDAVC